MGKEYEEETNEKLKGKTIVEANVDGFSIELKLSDNSTFIYDASDGGYSMWEIEGVSK